MKQKSDLVTTKEELIEFEKYSRNGTEQLTQNQKGAEMRSGKEFK